MMGDRPLAVVILAAGLGKRLMSPVPKVLQRAAGDELIHFVLRQVEQMGSLERLLVVVGHGKDQVIDSVAAVSPGAEFVEQTELLGTGDAVARCGPALLGFEGVVVVLPGDGPLVRAATLTALVSAHVASGNAVTVVTAQLDNSAGYGRITRDSSGAFAAIVEEADASPEEKAIKEVSGGIWCFEAGRLFDALSCIGNDNAQGEFYLPDAALVIRKTGGKVGTLMARDSEEIEGVNDRMQLAAAARKLQMRRLEGLSAAGVSIEDPATIFIDENVQIAPGAVIKPMCFLEGDTTIGAGCVIGPSVRLVDSEVAEDATISFSVVLESAIGRAASVGPFASIRPGTRVGPGAKVGTFVEVKASTLGEGSKVPHLSYLGDAEVGKGVNLGAGTITANYNSETKVKAKTVLGDGVFTGSHTTLVAPVKLDTNAGTGAGSVVTKDVGKDEIVVGVPARPLRKRRK